jgi:hypothetical protein
MDSQPAGGEFKYTLCRTEIPLADELFNLLDAHPYMVMGLGITHGRPPSLREMMAPGQARQTIIGRSFRLPVGDILTGRRADHEGGGSPHVVS